MGDDNIKEEKEDNISDSDKGEEEEEEKQVKEPIKYKKEKYDHKTMLDNRSYVEKSDQQKPKEHSDELNKVLYDKSQISLIKISKSTIIDDYLLGKKPSNNDGEKSTRKNIKKQTCITDDMFT